MVFCYVIGCLRIVLVIVNFDVLMKSEIVVYKIKIIVKLFNIFSLLDLKYFR